MSPPAPALGGAAIMTVGYLLATGHALTPVVIAAALTGIGQSAVHTTLQRWSTLAVPQARGVSTALFATGAFGGAALATLLATALPDQFTALFVTGAACAVASGVLAARHRAPTLAGKPAEHSDYQQICRALKVGTGSCHS